MVAKQRTCVSCPPRRSHHLGRKLENVAVDGCGGGRKPPVLHGENHVSETYSKAPRNNVKEEMDFDRESEVRGDGEDGDIRRRVKDLLCSFREVLEETKKANDRKPNASKSRDVHRDVAMQLARQGRWLNSLKRLGAVPGVEVGDEFGCRAEMRIIGLHCQIQHGIDYMNDCGPLATSIVESGRYANAYVDQNFLIYSGCGGNPLTNSKRILCDQKLDGGNLALKNSRSRKTPVRVIYKERLDNQQYIYKYRGLYLVEDLKQGRSCQGKLTFKFLLRRIEGHPKVNWEIESRLVNWMLLSDEGALEMEKETTFRTMAAPGRAKSRNMPNRGASMDCDRIRGCSSPENCSCKTGNRERLQHGCSVRMCNKSSLIHGFAFRTPLQPLHK